MLAYSLSLGDEHFIATTRFVNRWKKQHGILMKKASGEAGSAVEEGLVGCCSTSITVTVQAQRYV